ncbi:MAG: DUF1996 domain-containing protein [Actinomycetota bacterium]
MIPSTFRFHRPAAALFAICALTAVIVPLSARSASASARFHIECDHHHFKKDDPIAHRGHPGMSHMHEFFGNTSTNANSTWLSLRRAGTNCDNKADKAAYWMPALRKNGLLKKAVAGHFYFRGVHHNLGAVRAFPPGLKIIAGNKHAMRPQSTRVVAWSCRGSSGTGQATIRDCGAGGQVKALIKFPSCWDGRRKDSPNHKSHMAYATRLGGGRRGCTRTHPVPVPELTMAISFPIRNGSGVTLASGPPRTLHGDFFNAWNQVVLGNLIQNCIRANREC